MPLDSTLFFGNALAAQVCDMFVCESNLHTYRFFILLILRARVHVLYLRRAAQFSRPLSEAWA